VSAYATKLDSPFGMLVLIADELARLTHLQFVTEHATGSAKLLVEKLVSDVLWSHGHFDVVISQLNEYFHHQRKSFDLPCAARGSEFQRRVWQHIRTIPFGQVETYGEIALALGMRNGARAVGRASATNPLAIVVPCHRVVGSKGQLTGYAGGLAVKDSLLVHEGVRAPLLFS
jgi:methylated-DNA-[protein]-cysteine S-methyltransferase